MDEVDRPGTGGMSHELTVLGFVPGTQAHTCAVKCGGACCKYIALQIDTPTNKQDHDNIRWYLMHEDIHVYKAEGDWYLLVERRCVHLKPNNLCGAYETRPQVCRDYDGADCQYVEDEGYDEYFKSDAEYDEFLAARKARRSEISKRAAASRKKTATAKSKKRRPAKPPRQ